MAEVHVCIASAFSSNVAMESCMYVASLGLPAC